MNETLVTMVGNVASGVSYKQTPAGVPVANFRMAATERRYDRAAGDWIDGETVWVTVVAWRCLATNLVSSLNKGDPVLVSGRLRVREWTEGEKQRCAVEVDARVVGHDLARGTSAFRWAVQPKPGQVAGRAGSGGPAGAAGVGDGDGPDRLVPNWIVAAVEGRRVAQAIGLGGVVGGGAGGEVGGEVTAAGAAVLAAAEEVVDAVGEESGNEIVCTDRVAVG